MLTMTSVIVNDMFQNVVLTFYILQVGSPNVARPGGNLPPYSPSRRTWCINNEL